MDESTGSAAATTAAETVNRLLRTPVAASDLPLAVATYALPNPDPGAAQVRLLISVEIDRAVRQAAPVTVGYVILDERGKNVGASVEHLTLEHGQDDPDGGLRYLAAAVVPPGSYRMRVAASDPALRAGNVDHRVQARLTDAASLQLGDLVVLDRYPDPSGKPRPSVSATVSGSLRCYLEALARTDTPPSDLDVRIEIADAPDAPARIAAPMVGQSSASTPRRVQFSAGLALGDLPPGDYLARAIVSRAGRDVAVVTRPVRVVAGTAPEDHIRLKPDPTMDGHIRLKPDPTMDGHIRLKPDPTMDGHIRLKPDPTMDGQIRLEPDPTMDGRFGSRLRFAAPVADSPSDRASFR